MIANMQYTLPHACWHPHTNRGVQPGAKYKAKRAFGKQAQSTKRSQPQFSFGTGARKPLLDTGGGGESPGPGAYTAPSCFGTSPIKSQAPSFTLGARTDQVELYRF
jgi:hypothetical protein